MIFAGMQVNPHCSHKARGERYGYVTLTSSRKSGGRSYCLVISPKVMCPACCSFSLMSSARVSRYDLKPVWTMVSVRYTVITKKEKEARGSNVHTAN